MKPEIKWTDGAYVGDDRRVAMVGNVAVGAVFLNRGRGARYIRWRAWVTVNSNPSEGTARGEESAKREVEERFYRFLWMAGIMTIEEWEELKNEKA